MFDLNFKYAIALNVGILNIGNGFGKRYELDY